MGMHLAAIVGGAASLVGAAAALTARSSPAGWRSLPALALTYASATGFIVALGATPYAASAGSAALLGKREADGSLPLWSLLAFAPFHAGLRSKLAFQRARGTESNWDEVEPLPSRVGKGRRKGKVVLPFFLGGWPHEVDALPPGVSAVLDVTAELPRIAPAENFLNLRVWDTHGPSPQQIETAVRWIGAIRKRNKRVLVHCAHGHGRSVTVLAAVLLAEKEEEEGEEGEEEEKEGGEPKSCSSSSSSSSASSSSSSSEQQQIDSVISHIQKYRPRAKLNARQRAALAGWLELRREKNKAERKRG